MGRKHYSKEFQDEACKLVTTQGYTQKKAAEELGLPVHILHHWMKKRGLIKPIAGEDAMFPETNDPTLLKARIRDLEKQLRRSETEKEILKKATAYFASQHP
jgi:transposase